MLTALPQSVRDMPPCARLVYAALATTEDPLTRKALVTRTGVSRRGLTDALRQLRDRGLITAQVDPEDHRRRLYDVIDD